MKIHVAKRSDYFRRVHVILSSRWDNSLSCRSTSFLTIFRTQSNSRVCSSVYCPAFRCSDVLLLLALSIAFVFFDYGCKVKHKPHFSIYHFPSNIIPNLTNPQFMLHFIVFYGIPEKVFTIFFLKKISIVE